MDGVDLTKLVIRGDHRLVIELDSVYEDAVGLILTEFSASYNRSLHKMVTFEFLRESIFGQHNAVQYVIDGMRNRIATRGANELKT